RNDVSGGHPPGSPVARRRRHALGRGDRAPVRVHAGLRRGAEAIQTRVAVGGVSRHLDIRVTFGTPAVGHEVPRPASAGALALPRAMRAGKAAGYAETLNGLPAPAVASMR